MRYIRLNLKYQQLIVFQNHSSQLVVSQKKKKLQNHSSQLVNDLLI